MSHRMLKQTVGSESTVQVDRYSHNMLLSSLAYSMRSPNWISDDQLYFFNFKVIQVLLQFLYSTFISPSQSNTIPQIIQSTFFKKKDTSIYPFINIMTTHSSKSTNRARYLKVNHKNQSLNSL